MAFRPKLVPTLVALFAMLLTGSLGAWQTQRYFEQTRTVERYHEQHDVRPPVTTLAESATAPDRLQQLHFRQATLTGTLDLSHAHLLTARYVFGKLGYVLLAPLEVEGGPYPRILANVGWAPADKVQAWLDELKRNPHVTLHGRLQVADAQGAEEQPTGQFAGLKTWLHPNPAALAKQIPGLEPALMLQSGKQAAGEEVNPAKVPLDGYLYPVHPLPAKNVEYALTWFGIALTALAVWIALSREEVAPQ